jgi:hypothetical protein
VRISSRGRAASRLVVLLAARARIHHLGIAPFWST